MNTHPGSTRLRLSILAMIASLLIGLIGLPPASAVAAPTIGVIVVDDFDCETGALEARVFVTDLLHIPAPASNAEFPFRWNYEANFEGGISFGPSQFRVFNPPALNSPYTGDVLMTTLVPTTGPDLGNGPAPLASVFLEASVGHGVPGPIDAMSITHPVGCEDDSLIDALIAALKRILRPILGG